MFEVSFFPPATSCIYVWFQCFNGFRWSGQMWFQWKKYSTTTYI